MNSIVRDGEHYNAGNLSLDGDILDVGGVHGAEYQNRIKGNHTFTVINIDEHTKPDYVGDIEHPFPFADDTFDHTVCFNVLEHVFDVHTAFSEQVRCVKKGGTLVFATPFMHHIHGSPDDFARYTDSFYYKMAKTYGCEVLSIERMGYGFFSLVYQCLHRGIPGAFLKRICKRIAITFDSVLSKVSRGYKIYLNEKIPLGYFVVMRKTLS